MVQKYTVPLVQTIYLSIILTKSSYVFCFLLLRITKTGKHATSSTATVRPALAIASNKKYFELMINTAIEKTDRNTALKNIMPSMFFFPIPHVEITFIPIETTRMNRTAQTTPIIPEINSNTPFQEIRNGVSLYFKVLASDPQVRVSVHIISINRA